MRECIVFSLLMLIMMASLGSVLSLLTGQVTIISSGQIVHTLPLHVEGKYIKDSLNNTVYLRGFNRGCFGLTSYGRWQREGYTWTDGWSTFNEDGLRYQLDVLTEDWGINCMRWQLNFERILTNTDNIKTYLRRSIEVCSEYGIYVILAPNRLSMADSVKNHLPWGETHPEVFANAQDFIDFWIMMATELADLPNWIIDPYNEPTPRSSETEDADKQAWMEAVAGIIQGIRPICDNIVLVQWKEGEWYNGGIYSRLPEFISYLEERGLNDNIVLSTHNYHDNFVHYRYWEDPLPPNTLEQLRLDYENNGLAKAVREFNYPILIGETGADSSVEDWEQEKIWWNNTLTLYNEWGLSYMAWTWQVNPPFALIQDETFFPPPSEQGQILINAIERGKQ